MIFYTKNIYIYLKKKRLFSLPFHTPLICTVCTTSSPVTARGLWLHSFFKQHLYFNKKIKEKEEIKLKKKKMNAITHNSEDFD